MNGEERERVYRRFRAAVNMSPAQLERWLDTAQSQAVGQKRDGGESIGHQAGRRVVALLRTRRADLTDDDYRQMRRVAAFVTRRLAQRPSGDITRTRYRYSLMNWGHDPLTRR